ncbi:hypothetical protein DIPPA_00309 [Diplonema papillatum]|nr:hypothetical protein DIPPA_00309 [Diplonema papillatum]
MLGALALVAFSTAALLDVKSDQLIGTFGGRYTNVKIVSDGLPLACFNSEVEGGTSCVHCHDRLCQNVSHTVVDRSLNSNNARFIVMHAHPETGLAVMTYADQHQSTNQSTLKLDTCHDAACSTYTVTPLTSEGYPAYSAFAFAPHSHLPFVVYYNQGVGLQFIACHSPRCDNHSSPATLAGGADAGMYPSVAILDTGMPFISFYDGDSLSLRWVLCGDVGCQSATLGLVGSGPAGHEYGKYNAMVLADGLSSSGVYVDDTTGDFFFYNCRFVPGTASVACSSTKIDEIGVNAYGVFPEIDICRAYSPYPVMTYFSSAAAAAGQLKFAKCASATCDSLEMQTLANGTVGDGRDSSIGCLTHDGGGYIYVSYLDYNGGRDKHARLVTAVPNDAPEL